MLALQAMSLYATDLFCPMTVTITQQFRVTAVKFNGV